MAEQNLKQRARQAIAPQSAQLFSGIQKHLDQFLGYLPTNELRLLAKYTSDAAREDIEKMIGQALEENDTIEALEEAAIQAASEIGTQNQTEQSGINTANNTPDKKTEVWSQAGEQVQAQRDNAFSNSQTNAGNKIPTETTPADNKTPSPEGSPENSTETQDTPQDDGTYDPKSEEHTRLEQEYNDAKAHEEWHQKELANKKNSDLEQTPGGQSEQNIRTTPEESTEEDDNKQAGREPGTLERMWKSKKIKELENLQKQLKKIQGTTQKAIQRATEGPQKMVAKLQRSKFGLQLKLVAAYMQFGAEMTLYISIIAVGFIMFLVGGLLTITVIGSVLGIPLVAISASVMEYGVETLFKRFASLTIKIAKIHAELKKIDTQIKVFQKQIQTIQKIAYAKYQKETAGTRKRIEELNQEIYGGAPPDFENQS